MTAKPAGDPTPGDDLPPDVKEALDPRLQMSRWERWVLAVQTGYLIAGKAIEGFLGRRRYATIMVLLGVLAVMDTLGR